MDCMNIKLQENYWDRDNPNDRNRQLYFIHYLSLSFFFFTNVDKEDPFDLMRLLMAFYRFALFLYQNITVLHYAVKYKVPCVMLSTGSPSSGLKLKIEY